jgi:hypothetical protein
VRWKEVRWKRGELTSHARGTGASHGRVQRMAGRAVGGRRAVVPIQQHAALIGVNVARQHNVDPWNQHDNKHDTLHQTPCGVPCTHKDRRRGMPGSGHNRRRIATEKGVVVLPCLAIDSHLDFQGTAGRFLAWARFPSHPRLHKYRRAYAQAPHIKAGTLRQAHRT